MMTKPIALMFLSLVGCLDPGDEDLSSDEQGVAWHGMPYGFSGMTDPASEMTAKYNATQSVWGEFGVLDQLAEIKAKGGHASFQLSGPNSNFSTNCLFDMAKWKNRIDRWVPYVAQLEAYVNSGTLIGNFLIDQPEWFEGTDASGNNCAGHDFVSGSEVEEMARYSKAKLPGIPTIVRSAPSWLESQRSSYTYLDTAWLQYVSRYGDPATKLSTEVAAAKARHLGMVVGLNLLKGDDNNPLTDSQITSWGNAMLGSTYPCVFSSWHYDASYISAHAAALTSLANKAANRAASSCVKH